jgi:hypothetical protein
MDDTKKDIEREFTEFVVKSIVDHPDDVKVKSGIDEKGTFIQLWVNAMDMGQVVGRQGKTATAIRTLLKIVGIKNGVRANFKIEEPEGGTHPMRTHEEAGSEDAEL